MSTNPTVTDADIKAANTFANFFHGAPWSEYALDQLAIEFAGHREAERARCAKIAWDEGGNRCDKLVEKITGRTAGEFIEKLPPLE